MGTAAFVYVGKTYPDNSSLVIGMTSDGFIQNLEMVAAVILRTAKELRCWTMFKAGDAGTIERVLRAVVERPGNEDLFVSTVGEAEWISYSAWINLRSQFCEFYEGALDRRVDYSKNIAALANLKLRA